MESGLNLYFSNLSFDHQKRNQSGPYETTLRGVLHLFNTKEAYEAANVQDIYDKERKANFKEYSNLKFLNTFEYKDMERRTIRFFALIMFADLKSYVFKSKFFLLSAE